MNKYEQDKFFLGWGEATDYVNSIWDAVEIRKEEHDSTQKES